MNGSFHSIVYLWKYCKLNHHLVYVLGEKFILASLSRIGGHGLCLVCDVPLVKRIF